MKKKWLNAKGYDNPLFKWLRIMKLTLFILLVAFVHVSASVNAQQTRLSVSVNNASVKEVLRSIEDQSDYFFLYKNENVDVNRVVSINTKDKSVQELLEMVFKGTDITYEIHDRQIVLVSNTTQNEIKVTGKVIDSSGQPLPGVSIVVKGSSIGTTTDFDGNYSISNVPEDGVFVFSFVGMKTQEIPVSGKSTINVEMAENAIGVDEVVVVGYGSQKKSDITGSVASLPQERLELVPNLNVAQAIQGSMPGILITTNAAGAAPDNEATSIMIRGRNSIKASNGPLVVVDGIPYGGQLSDISPNDIKSIEILKDASSAAIYGSRGSNGVILITTKLGASSKPVITYDGYYSLQKMINFPELMDGEEFYQFKKQREPNSIHQSEQKVYDNKSWVYWPDLALRDGQSHQHTVSVSGGSESVKYYVSTNVLDVRGLAVNDDYLRVTGRINIDMKITDWLTLGTRTSLSYSDQSGESPDFNDVTYMNPLTTAYNDDGTLTIYPNPDDIFFGNPLQATMAQSIDKSHQVITNNFVKVDFPFVKGLQYQLNSSFRFKYSDYGRYYGRDTQRGISLKGETSLDRSKYMNETVENILSYTREFGKHNVFITASYNFEENESNSNKLYATGFPHDILGWYASGQAELVTPSFSYNKTDIVSQLLRINYGYDSRYLLTITERRDGYSGFGAKTKWGNFPSVALGWNIANEKFFSFKNIINTLKLRASWGNNGNQSVGAYETISRLKTNDWVSGASTQPGYIPSKLGADNLGWESTEQYNFGLDYGILSNRITGEINAYFSETTGLLLDRSISPVHGVDVITQNIGSTQNNGFEFSINSKNIDSRGFKWSSNFNLSTVKNKIVSLYGLLDDQGNEIDDVGNRWFIGKPIRVIYDHEVIGVWQLGEEEEAAKYGSEPGRVKLRDIDGDYDIDDDDRFIIGQRDPKFIWGLTNSFSYKNFTLNVFMHGVHGVTKDNSLKSDGVWTEVRRNTTLKNWWTPNNPTNDFYKNAIDAEIMGSGNSNYYEDASFIRIKDISLAYDLPKSFLQKTGIGKAKIYLTGRNLFTITKFGGLDPELDNQRAVPLQKEYVIGINIGL